MTGCLRTARPHNVAVTFPGGAQYGLNRDSAQGPDRVVYGRYVDGPPVGGDYVFTVTDPAGNTGEYVDTLTAVPLTPPDEDTLSPSLKPEHATVTFDNVWVNGSLYDAFDYGSFSELGPGKWQGPWGGAWSVQDGAVACTVSDSVGRVTGTMRLADPGEVKSISVDVTLDESTVENGYGRLTGYFFHNGEGEAFANVRVTPDKVTYSVTEDIYAETVSWKTLAHGQLMTASPGQTVRLSMAWNGHTLTFGADENRAYYTPPAPVFPSDEASFDIQARMHITTDTTPTFTFGSVPGAVRQRARVYTYNGDATVWRANAGPGATYTVPPGILKPDSMYSYRIDSWDAHSGFDIDNWAKTPASNSSNYQFYTGADEAVAPAIDFDGTGVATWNDAVYGAHTNFWIKVHDAQGVPEDIERVTVTFPGGAEQVLYYDRQNGDNTPTCGIYRANVYGSPTGGTYTFNAEDREGHSAVRTEELTANPIGYPAAETITVTLDGTAVEFDWADVDGAAFYRVELFDEDYERVYAFSTVTSDYHLAPGFLKEGALYRYRITTRREFFDENHDNASSSPWTLSDSPTLVAGQPVATASPSVDTDNMGVVLAMVPGRGGGGHRPLPVVPGEGRTTPTGSPGRCRR